MVGCKCFFFKCLSLFSKFSTVKRLHFLNIKYVCKNFSDPVILLQVPILRRQAWRIQETNLVSSGEVGVGGDKGRCRNDLALLSYKDNVFVHYWYNLQVSERH